MKNKLTNIAIFLMVAGLVAAPQDCIAGAGNSLALCARVVIPSLFPFLVCSKLLVETGFAHKISKWCSPVMRPLFNVPGCGSFAFVMGILSGYPVGAKCAAALYREGLCTKTEAQRMTAFCNNSGPLFIIGSIGIGFLGSYAAGITIYAAHVLSAVTVGLLFRNYKKSDKIAVSAAAPAPASKSLGKALSTSIEQSVSLMLYICGFIIFFGVVIVLLEKAGVVSLLARLLSLIGIAPDAAGAMAYGFLEITNGAAKAAMLGMGNFTTVLISAMVAFSGMSVLLQVMGVTAQEGIGGSFFVIAKILQAVFAAVYTALLVRIPALSSPAFADASLRTVQAGSAFKWSVLLVAAGVVTVLVLAVCGYIFDRVYKHS